MHILFSFSNRHLSDHCPCRFLYFHLLQSKFLGFDHSKFLKLMLLSLSNNRRSCIKSFLPDRKVSRRMAMTKDDINHYPDASSETHRWKSKPRKKKKKRDVMFHPRANLCDSAGAVSLPPRPPVVVGKLRRTRTVDRHCTTWFADAVRKKFNKTNTYVFSPAWVTCQLDGC